jgi:uncharacterized protein (DUF2062 family)
VRGGYLPVVIAPSFDNATALPGVLKDLASLGIEVIAVNDGSTDETAELLSAWAADGPGRTVLTHPFNRGKAAALRTGFAHATAAGFTHAVTIDTDGQLSAADIPRLLDAARDRPEAFVLGVRDITAADYPARSRAGRRISNRLIWVQTRVRVGDSQCGLRVYPLNAMPFDQCSAGHYGFETEVITRAVWAGVPLVQLPVACRYFAPAERVSHFRPGLDSLRAARLHLGLLLAASMPGTFRRRHSIPGRYPARSLPVRFFHWISPVEAWRQVRRGQAGRTRFAVGLAAGTFIGTIPTYGIQTILSLFVAKKFRLHPASVLAGSNVSTPPLGPVLLAVSVAAGHLMLRGQLPHWGDYRPSHLRAVIGPLLLDYLVGSLLVGAIFGAVVFVCIDGLLRLLPGARPAGEPA